MEFDLVCQDAWIPSFIIAMSQIAIAIGALFSGPVCDRFGRKRTMVAGFSGVMFFGYALPFMPNWWSFTIVWSAIHLPLFFTNTASAVFVVEIVGPTKRSLAVLSKHLITNKIILYTKYNLLQGQTTMSISGPLVSLVAYFLPDWTQFTFFLVTLAIALFLLVIIIPESPRWV